MKRLSAVMFVAAVAILIFFQVASGDEASDFRKNMKRLKKELKIARAEYERANDRFNHIRSFIFEMDKKHKDYSSLAKEHNDLQAKMPQLIQAVGIARQNVQQEIVNFLGRNNVDVVKAVQKEFFKGSSAPDVSIELAVVAGLQKVTDGAAIDFMLEELAGSRVALWKKVLCLSLMPRTEDKVRDGLIKSLEDRDLEVAVAAAEALAKRKEKQAVEPLISAYERAAGKNDEGAMRGIRSALREITNEYMLDTPQDFRNWYEGKGKEGFDPRQATARPKGLIGKDGPRSTLYGVITSKNIIFICDVSHSMSASGTVPANPTDGSDSGEKRPETGGDFQPGGKKKEKNLGLGGQGVQPGFTGMRIDILKIELEHVVKNMLPDDAKFNLIAYSDNLLPWKKKLTKAEDRNKQKAVDFVKKMEPKGSTNTHDALELAFTDKSVDTIYFLSDGAPTSGKLIHPDEILFAVRRWNQGRKVIIHTIGLLVGKYQQNENHEPLKKFLQRLASDNGGECRIFENK